MYLVQLCSAKVLQLIRVISDPSLIHGERGEVVVSGVESESWEETQDLYGLLSERDKRTLLAE